MKRKFFAAFLSLCMVMSLVPMAALAAEDTGTISEPTASGNAFFANGTPITISADVPADATAVTFEGLNNNGEATAYISWTDDSGKLVYLEATAGLVYVFGGGNGSSSPVSIASTNITMTGGKIRYLYGGNYGSNGKTEGTSSTVVGDVHISLSGSAAVDYVLYGGGMQNTGVEGTVYMDFDGVDLSSDKTDSCYVNGGVHGNGQEGTRNIEEGTMTTDAVVNQVVITATDSKFYLLGGGGGGSTKVNDSDVTLTNCEVDYLYLSGINGEVVNSSIVATDCKIGSFSATNRGFVGTASVDLNVCEITDKLNFGAADGCFSSDSGTPDGSGVTSSIVWSLDAETTVTNAQLTPLVVRTGEASDPNYATTYENVTIQKEGTPLNVVVSDFTPVQMQDGTKVTLNTFTVPENSTLILKGVEATVADGNTITNAGTIDMDDASSLTVASGATLEQAGTVNGGKVEGEGTVTEYVARVGNTGYESLEAALEAVKASGGTITLLQNATLDNANYTISKPVTIQGNHKVTVTANANDSAPNTPAFAVTAGSSLTLDGVQMTIKGTETKGDNGNYNGQGLNLYNSSTRGTDGAALTLTNGASLTLTGLESGMVFPATATEYATVTVEDGSSLSISNIDGNASNGGDWNVKGNSSLSVSNCGSHGLSTELLTVDASRVTVDNAGYCGIVASEVTLSENANVSITNCGEKLPYPSNGTSQWAPDGTSYKNAMELKKEGEGLTVTNSTLSLTNNENADGRSINSIYVGSNKVENEGGQILATLKLAETSDKYTVTYINNGQVYNSDVVAKSDANYTLIAGPADYGYNHFVGWTDQAGKHYDGGDTVTITANTTFTAQWSYIPPANPNYKITIGAMENGTVTANPTAAKAGATVTLTPVPDEGYALSTLTVTDRFGDAVRVTEQADGTYTFTMPNGQVTVTATFVQVEEPAPTEPFIDVAEGDWFYDAVVYAYQNELMDGVGGNRFAPNSETTRAQLVTILYRLEGQPTVSGDLPFTDVEAGIWYTDAILWAAQNNIVNGVSDTEFAPGDDLTRQQLVTILYRYAEAKGYDVSASADLSGYPDADQVQDYAQPAMAWAVAENIIQGMEDGTLKPAGNASRAQIATILMRFCEDVAQ